MSMKHVKLFESYSIGWDDFPKSGYNLSNRENKILEDIVGIDNLKSINIKKEDFYYYTRSEHYNNIFTSFNELKDYIQFKIYIKLKDHNKFLNLLKITKLDMSFDDNCSILWASENGYCEIVKLLLNDPRVDPNQRDHELNASSIDMSIMNGHINMVKILAKDHRVEFDDGDGTACICEAASSGYKEIVEFLLTIDKVDPSVYDNSAIELASDYNHRDIVRILIKDHRVRAKLTPYRIRYFEKY